MKQIQPVKIILLALAFACAACSPKVDSKGYVRSANWKDAIVIGQTTKQEVLDTFGSPSVQSTFGQESWYYITARKETVAFFKPELVEQDAVRIEFDAGGVVRKVENYDKNNAKDFALIKRTTPTEGHSLNFFEQVMGNLGRFNKPGGNDSVAPGRRPGN